MTEALAELLSEVNDVLVALHVLNWDMNTRMPAGGSHAVSKWRRSARVRARFYQPIYGVPSSCQNSSLAVTSWRSAP